MSLDPWSPQHLDLVLQRRRLSSISQRLREGVVTREEHDVEKNRIVYALVDLSTRAGWGDFFQRCVPPVQPET